MVIWILRVVCVAISGALVYKVGWFRPQNFWSTSKKFSAGAQEESGVQSLGCKTDSYRQDLWDATVFSSRYQGINICVADTYNEKAREVTCVVDSAVTSEAIGRFVLMADAAKMDRSSKDVRPLDFIRSDRDLMRDAKNDSRLTLYGKRLSNKAARQMKRGAILVAVLCAVWYIVPGIVHSIAAMSDTPPPPPPPPYAPPPGTMPPGTIMGQGSSHGPAPAPGGTLG